MFFHTVNENPYGRGYQNIKSYISLLRDTSYFFAFFLFFFILAWVRRIYAIKSGTRAGVRVSNSKQIVVDAIYYGAMAYIITASYIFWGNRISLNYLCFVLFVIPPFLFLLIKNNRSICIALLGLIWLPSLVALIVTIFSSWIGPDQRAYTLVAGGMLSVILLVLSKWSCLTEK